MTTYCSTCGTPSVPGASFCSGCGQRVVAPERNCPTCGQVWPNAPHAQPPALVSPPASSPQAWPAPTTNSASAGLSSFPPPAPSNFNPQGFPPPPQASSNVQIKLPVYGKNFIEGSHCGNCGAQIQVDLSECISCGTADYSKLTGASRKTSTPIVSNQEL